MALEYAPYIEGSLQEYVGAGAYPAKFGSLRYLKDEDGKPLYEAEPNQWGRKVQISEHIEGEWRENEPFRSFLTYETWYKGRSAVRIIWKDEEEHTFPMFMTDFDRLMHSGKIGGAYSNSNGMRTGAAVFGLWHVVKRGANYGLAWMGPDN